AVASQYGLFPADASGCLVAGLDENGIAAQGHRSVLLVVVGALGAGRPLTLGDHARLLPYPPPVMTRGPSVLRRPLAAFGRAAERLRERPVAVTALKAEEEIESLSGHLDV